MPKRDRPWDEPSKPGAQGGAPLSTALKEVIVHMYYDEDMSIDEIYPLTKSPRSGGKEHILKKTAKSVIEYYDAFGTVEPAPRAARTRKMTHAHGAVLISIVRAEPYLYLKEIAQAMTERTGVEYSAIPHLGDYSRGEDNSILVLDNCQIHKTRLAEFEAMVEAQGAKLVFLAPYCPIDNPIEKAFNVFKQFWRLNFGFLEHLEAGTGACSAIEFAMGNCYKDPATSALRTYTSCGYVA